MKLQNSKLVFLIGLSACAFHQPRAPSNVTDYIYMQKSKEITVSSTAFSTRRALDGVLYSKCKWLPSDSGFFEATSKSCGTLKAMVFALGRALEESDIAGDPKRPVLNYDGHLRWVHMPLECEL